MSLTTTMIFVTIGLAFTAFALGGQDTFTCDDPNDCTGAAIEDIADFDLSDILDILQLLFIFFGDMLELGVYISGLLGPVGTFLLLMGFSIPWAIIIIGIARGVST